MYKKGETGYTLLTKILSDLLELIELHPNVDQQVFLVQELLRNSVICYQLDPDQQEGNRYIDKLEKKLVNEKLKIINDLIPIFEESGDLEKLSVLNELIRALDCVQTEIDCKPRLDRILLR